MTLYSAPSNTLATVSGTFVARQSVAGTTVAGGQSSPFALTYDASYQDAPSLATSAGTWSIAGGGTIAIGGTGAVTAVQDGCTYTAQLTPDSSGKNFFRIAGNFGPAPCDLPGAAASGILTADATTLVAGIVSGSAGAAFVATKN
jgi:hypothetical protein